MRWRPVLAVVHRQRWVAQACMGLLCAALSACMVPQWQAAGTPASVIAQGMGAPHVQVLLPDGGQRWVYSQQPAGQQVYHMVLDDQQRLRHVEQVLQEPYFAQLKVGVDDQRSVHDFFGKPAVIERVGSFAGDVWTYRLRSHSIDRQAHVFIDPQGIVQRVMFTDENRVDEDRSR